jgi:ABC-2 type transport system ATP-binding protein
MSPIEVRDLRKRYTADARPAVDGVTFDVQRGEVYALLGHNGAGKTTTVEILEGHRRATSGTARVLGIDPASADRELRDRVGIVLQSSGVEPQLTVREALDVYGGCYRRRRATTELVELAGLDEKADARIGSLSGGQRRRLDLALAIVGSPEVLFLDEPTIGLDVVAQHNIQQFLKHYQQVRGITILLTSHYMKDVAALCQRVVIIAGGKIVYDGSLDGIIDQFSNYKVVTLDFADDRMPGDLSALGEVVELIPPRVKLEVDRSEIATVLAKLLGAYAIQDVSVEDPPLEEVIASLFALTEQEQQASEADAKHAAEVAANP